MTVEEALRGALKYETAIRDIYREAARGTREDEARSLYEILEKDEQSHIDFLNFSIDRWKREGKIDASGLTTALPPAARIEKALERAGSTLTDAKAGKDEGGERNALERAFKAEVETSAYYRTLASTLPDDARRVFERFVEIEDGHTSIVRAELDLNSRTGYWFDVREFDLED